MSNQDKKIKVLLMGTPEFSVPGFKSLIEDDDFEIVGLYTQADKAVGRGQKMSAPATKLLAIENNIPVFQPLKIKTEVENIKKLNPDIILVIAYGEIITPEILAIPRFNCINVHASLLPKYRGASCLNAPILNGDEYSGITIMLMEAGLDTGPVIRQERLKLEPREDLSSLHDKLSSLAAKVLPETLKAWVNKELKAKEQDGSNSSYVKILKKEDGKLDLSDSALNLDRKIRAFNPWPGSYVFLEDMIMKIISAEVDINEESDKNLVIGQLYLKNNNLMLKCGQNSLVILKLQLPGKRALSSKEFLNGRADIIGKIVK